MSVLETRLQGRRVIICTGAGGVGKTTLSAAIAIGLAAHGLRVAVVTIDPARRLAEALGLDELGNEPRLVDAARFSAHGTELRGELWAMMLDAKLTFDELIAHLAPDEPTRDRILQNAIYRQLSGAVGGSQEFTAIAKLYELDRDGGFDAVVLDTPPSRNALDFLDAPDRLMAFFDGRALKLFLAPTGAARIMSGGISVVFTALRRLTGVNLLEDLAAFFQGLSSVIDGLRHRAAEVRALLADPATTFLVVSTPERASVEEAIFFTNRLRTAHMSFGGLIVNRVHPLDPGELDQATTTARLEGALGTPLARRVALTHAQIQVLARRDAAGIERLRRELDEPSPVIVEHLARDVHDVSALLAVQARLFDGT